MTEETTREEYHSYEKKRDARQREVDRYETKVSNLDEEIRRLQKARDEIDGLYASFKEEAKSMDKYLSGSFQFQGTNKESLIDYRGGNVLYALDHAKKKIVNKALDDIEDLLTEKKNERDSANGLLGKAKAALRSIRNWLNTHFFNN